MSDESSRAAHLAKHQFKPGQSGHPGGRKKGIEGLTRVVMKSRKYVSKDGKEYWGAEAVIHMWLDIAFDHEQKANDRITAGVRAIERGYGSVKQVVKLESEDRGAADTDPQAMSTEDIREALGAIATLKRIGGVEVSGDADDTPTEH